MRLLDKGDLPSCLELSTAAGWNQTPADWERLLTLSPDLCFGIEIDGTIAATATALCYGRELAWIGMVLTHTSYQRRGLARQLVSHVIEILRHREVAWAKLDASDMGYPLYRQLGFADAGRIARWGRPAGPKPAPLSGLGTGSRDGFEDRFPVDRSALLEALAHTSAALPGEGYALGRPGSRAAYFGPCVAESPEAARRLLRWFLESHGDEEVYWDLFPDNQAAVALAEAEGFRCLRRLPRMALALFPDIPPLVDDVEHQYAIAGPEYG